MRGFSINEPLLPAVVVNMKDAPAARVFSLLHEMVHLLLHESGLCDGFEGTSLEEERVEVFCNWVAGAMLVPAEWLVEEAVVRAQDGPRWSDEALTFLAQRYKVSREVVIRRLLLLGRTTEAFHKKKRKELQAEFQAKQEQELQKRALGLVPPGFATPDRVAVSTAGPLFVRLVLNSYSQEKITSNDLSSFLEVRLKHLEKIEAVHRQLEGRFERVDGAETGLSDQVRCRTTALRRIWRTIRALSPRPSPSSMPGTSNGETLAVFGAGRKRKVPPSWASRRTTPDLRASWITLSRLRRASAVEYVFMTRPPKRALRLRVRVSPNRDPESRVVRGGPGRRQRDRRHTRIRRRAQPDRATPRD